MSFWHELRRRKVFKVGATYLIVAWLLMQVAGLVFPQLQLPAWAPTLVTVLAIAGFPIALLLAWAFELTPDGIRLSQRDSSAEYRTSGSAVDFVLFAGLLVIASVIVWGQFRSPRAAETQMPAAGDARPSIAVLPFDDMSQQRDQGYLGEGIADELLNALTRIGGIDVAARTSSFAFRGGAQSVPEIGRSLGVATVLEGGIRKDGDTIRVTAQLINVADGYHLWSATFDRDLDDIFTVQEEIAATVAGALGVQLGVADSNAFVGAGTRNVEAYELYLRAGASGLIGNRGLGGATINNAQRIRLLRQALDLDPSYAAAWARLGLVTASNIWQDVPSAAADYTQEGLEYTRRAIELDPQSAAGYTQLGTVLYALYDWRGAEQAHARAAALNPSADLLFQHGHLLLRAGRSAAALSQYDAGSEQSASLARTYVDFRIQALLALRRFGDAAELIRGLNGPQRTIQEYALALNEHSPDDVRNALEALARLGDPSQSLYENVLAAFEDPGAALTVLHDASAAPEEWPSKFHDMSMLAAYFGDAEFALQLKAEEVRYAPMRLFTMWQPLMDQARHLPEFKQLVSDIHLVDYWREYGWADTCRPTNETDFVCN